MHKPANVGSQLLSFRAGEEHRIVERVQEPVLGEPTPSLDEFLVHDTDLSGRASEADESQLEPKPKRLT
jgi:hypothetical protein